jgi:hypothetical protein
MRTMIVVAAATGLLGPLAAAAISAPLIVGLIALLEQMSRQRR